MEGIVHLFFGSIGGGAVFRVANNTTTTEAQAQNLANTSPKSPKKLSTSLRSSGGSEGRKLTNSGGEKRTVRQTVFSQVEKSGVDKDGNKFLNQYLFIKTISKGSFSKARLALSTEDNKYYCIKVIKTLNFIKAAHELVEGYHNLKTTDMDKALLYKEVDILKSNHHPNIVGLIEVIEDFESKSNLHGIIYEVQEYCKLGPITLNTIKNSPYKNPLEACRQLFRGIVSGLSHLHSQYIIHGDIKPENILVDSSFTVKLCDFLSLSKGTPAFFAPEVCSLHNNSSSSEISFATDIWCLGVTLYFMVQGRLPWTGDNEPELFQSICERELIWDEIEGEGEDRNQDGLEDLVRGMLNKNPDKRVKIDWIQNHRWVTKKGKDKPVNLKGEVGAAEGLTRSAEGIKCRKK